MNTKPLLVIAAFCSVGNIGCRETNQNSSLRTLDNIASANPVFEACSGTGAIHRKADLDAQPHLRAALAAIPLTLQQAFFDDLGGKIKLVAGPALTDCSNDLERADDALSCWRRSPNRDASIEILIRKSDPTHEQYALVRAFGFVYGDILLNRVIPNVASEPVTLSERPMGSLRDFKAHLASVFLGDLSDITPAGKEKELVSSLEKLGIPSRIVREHDFQKRWKLYVNLPTNVQDTFASRVFAESFHSQFCTNSSADRACKLFGNTMDLFAPYARDLTSADWMRSHQCQKQSSSLTQSQTNSSSTRKEWFSQFSSEIQRRRNLGYETGSLVNAKIAEAAGIQKTTFGLTEKSQSLNLSGDLASMLKGLLTGGVSLGGSGGSGFMGMLSQVLGSVGGSGGGGSGGLSGILSSLGLGSSGGGNIGSLLGNSNSLPGGGGSPTTPSNSVVSNNPSSSIGGSASSEEKSAIDATNKYRQSQGAQPLQTDEQMIGDCRKQAQMQAERGGLEHFLYPAGVATGENIAYGSSSGEYTVMEQWVKSPGHHANIMGNYRFIGVGSVGNQWCQRFR